MLPLAGFVCGGDRGHQLQIERTEKRRQTYCVYLFTTTDHVRIFFRNEMMKLLPVVGRTRIKERTQIYGGIDIIQGSSGRARRYERIAVKSL